MKPVEKSNYNTTLCFFIVLLIVIVMILGNSLIAISNANYRLNTCEFRALVVLKDNVSITSIDHNYEFYGTPNEAEEFIKDNRDLFEEPLVIQ